YASITAGIVILSPSTLQLQDGSSLTPESSVRFAFTAALGLKVWITPMIGLRFDVRALVPVYFSGGGFYVGTGGAGVGLSGGIPFAHFAFTGGLGVAPLAVGPPFAPASPPPPPRCARPHPP